MKKVIVLVVLMVMGYSIQAQGVQITIGTATYSGSDYNLIWDDDNNGNSVVWLDYTNSPPTNWTNQKSWALGLNDAGVLTYNVDPGYAVTWDDDWRLPTTWSEVGGYNLTTSEMGHLYYTELGNAAGGPLSTTGDFQNLNSYIYWSGTEYSANNLNAWSFHFHYGDQITYLKNVNLYGLAVRSGDVAAVPEPTTMALLGIGLFGLASGAVRRRLKGRRE